MTAAQYPSLSERVAQWEEAEDGKHLARTEANEEPNMTAAFPTRLERQTADSLARSDDIAAAKDLREDAQTAINDHVRAFRRLFEIGVNRAYLDDALRGLSDEAATIQARVWRLLNGADPYADEIDLSELRDLLAKVRS
jgi:hypothetical protein